MGLDTELASGDFLEFDLWRDVVNLLADNRQQHMTQTVVAGSFAALCADLTHFGGSGEVLLRGYSGSSCSFLYVARVNENHVVVLLRARGHRSVGSLRGEGGDGYVM